MKTNTLAVAHGLAIGLFLCASGIAQLRPGQIDAARVPVPQAHDRAEYALDTPTDSAGWARLEPGLHAAFGTTDELYLRCELPAPKGTAQAWHATGWRGERLNAQVLIWSADAVEQVRLTASDLTNATGQVIDRSHFSLSVVRYVVSNFPYRAEGFTCDVNNESAFLVPDRLDPLDRFDLPGRTVRPVWVSFTIPRAAQPGEYHGALRIESSKHRVTLPATLKVQSLTLPEPRDWRFRLDLWQNPWVVAAFFRVPPWSDEHKALLRGHLKAYADAGGTYITTYAVHSPWSDNSYVLEGAMIEWIKRADGTWTFDYRIFDQYVALAMECGISRAITVYTPLPWGHRFRYLDEASGNYVETEWPPDSDGFRQVWGVFLEDLKKHLVQKGWFEKTYLGINENPLEHTLAAIRVIKQHSTDWKITYAGEWHPELSSLVDDYSAVINREPRPEDVRSRSARGFTTTFYVCCNPPRPNTFVFSAPVESRYLGWHAAGLGYDGFLRWAYDAWPADPVRDARHRLWPAGDCFLVYPGAASSIRFEELRAGIVDYEKIRLLRELAARSSSRKVQNLRNQLEAHLRALPRESDYGKRDYSLTKVTAAVHGGVQLVHALSDELGN